MAHSHSVSTLSRLGLLALLLGATGASTGCDKLPSFGGDGPTEADATADAKPATDPASDPAPDPASDPALDGTEAPVPTPSPSPDPASTPDPAPAPAAAPSEWEHLLIVDSMLAAPQRATEPSVDADNKTAWTHYKAKEWTKAAEFFARVAARDPAWKHAHNLACASAQAGKPDDARVALAESFRRGGAAAKASANKDSDLAAVRKLPWFAELIAEPNAPASVEELDDDELQDIPPPNCPPGTTVEDQHYCWHDVLAEWSYAEVAFATPVTLDIEVPSRPKTGRWVRARGKIDWKTVRAELGIQHTIESAQPTVLPKLLEWSSNVWWEIVDDEDELTKPYFWWPEDNTPILVLPNRQKLGSRRFMGVVLARKTESGWQAINVAVTTPKQLEGSTNETFESTVLLRFDALELFTLTQFVYHDDYGDNTAPAQRFLCRMGWDQGKLVRACVEKWTETNKVL